MEKTAVAVFVKAPLKTAIPVALLFCYEVLAIQPELRLVVPLLTGLTAAITIILAISRWDRLNLHWAPATILAVAVVIRLLFLFAPPQLSDDVYRYVWDGTRTIEGANPYRHPPALVTPPPHLHGIHSRINHAEFPTIYPPAAQLIFAAGAAVQPSTAGLKTVLVIIDLLLCLLLMLLLHRLELPVSNAVLYAWNPLPVLEIAGSGHVDGAGMTMVAGALALLIHCKGNTTAMFPQRRAVIGAGTLTACAAMVKLFPLLICPGFFLLVPRRHRVLFLTSFAGTVGILTGLFLPHLANALVSLRKYILEWEFAGFAFTSLRELAGSGSTARLIIAAVFLGILGTLFFNQARSRVELNTIVEQERRAVKACYLTAFLFLMLTPTLQPWYALLLAVFLPLCPGPGGLVLCWAVFLTYQVQIPYFILGKWIESPFATAIVFWAPITAGLSGILYKGLTEARLARRSLSVNS